MKRCITILAAGLALATPAFADQTPMGWQLFCIDHASDCRPMHLEAKMRLTHRLLDQLTAVNRQVNRTVKYQSDGPGLEFWRYPDNGRGDCEDIALAKRRALIRHGIPQAALGLALASYRKDRNEGHAVLLVYTTKGAMVLDNAYRDPLPIEATGKRYIYLSLQDRADPGVWHRINWPSN